MVISTKEGLLIDDEWIEREEGETDQELADRYWRNRKDWE